MAKPGIALQLFSLREELRQDFVGTLEAVAEIGYSAVELVSYYGHNGLTGAELNRTLADLRLTPMGVHVSADTLAQTLEKSIEYYREAGVTEIIAPSLPRGSYDNPESCKRGGEWLGRVADRCHALGARLSYHSHHSDFVHYGDSYELDLILGDSDPFRVGLEADVYWIAYAGEDPATIIRRYADRIRFVHLKDRPAQIDVRVEDVFAGKADGSRMFREVGEGVVDWPSVFAAAEATPAQWYVVEQDVSSRPMLESVAISFRHLKEWGKV